MIINKPTTNGRNQPVFLYVDTASMVDFLQGAARAWCKAFPETWFSASDFLGGVNFNWESTPMQALYDLYDFYNPDADPAKHDDAVQQAGQAAGYLLWVVLDRDSRKFKTEIREAHGRPVRHYLWIN